MRRSILLLALGLLACEDALPPATPWPPAPSAVRQIAFRASDTVDLVIDPLYTQDSARVEVLNGRVRLHGRVLGGYRTDRVYTSLYQLGDTLFLDAITRGGIPFAGVNYYRYTLEVQPLTAGALRIVATGVRTDTTLFPVQVARTVILDTLLTLPSQTEQPPPQIALPSGHPIPVRFLVDDSITIPPPLGDTLTVALTYRHSSECPNLVAQGEFAAATARPPQYRLTRLADTFWIEPLSLAPASSPLVRYGYRLETEPLSPGQYRVVAIGVPQRVPGPRPSRQLILDTTLTISQTTGCAA